MANGAGTFDVIKDILNKDVLDDSDAHRLLLAAQLDLNAKFEKRVEDTKVVEEKKDAEQKKYNDMVIKMWPVHKVTLAILFFFGTSIGALIWSIITDKVNIVVQG